MLHQAGTVTLDGDSYTYDNAGNLVTAIVRRSKNIAPAFLQGLAQFGAS
ncbi:MAG: hypothetical protein ACM3SW_17100 [Actinomycetota bacterium]